jgi:hypothetical protein
MQAYQATLVTLAMGFAVMARPPAVIAAPQRIGVVVGITPRVPDTDVADVQREILSFVLGPLPCGSTLTLYDAVALQRIVEFRIPDDEIYASPKLRASHLAPELATLQQFFRGMREMPDDRTSRIDQPRFLDFVGKTLAAPDRPIAVLLIGSPIYVDAREPAFSMEHGFFPSDGHLLARRERSPFSTVDRGNALRAVRVHWAYPRFTWQSDVHAYRVERFWRLFVNRQGGELVTFTSDRASAFERLLDHAASSPPTPNVDPDDTKVEMYAIRRDAHEEWLTGDVEHASAAPVNPMGSVKIGLRWACSTCDLDLFSQLQGSSEISFREPRTDVGFYVKDFRSPASPSTGFEYIEYRGTVDVRRLSTWVNFYSGKVPGGVDAELRVLFNDRQYAKRFRLAASEGDYGRGVDRRRGDPHWMAFDIAALVGIGAATDAPLAETSSAAAAPKPARVSVVSSDDGRAPFGLRILSPADRSEIVAARGETIASRSVTGDIIGLRSGDAADYGFRVRVTVTTDREYPQGIALVDPSGTWVLPAAHFGGEEHVIRAELLDRNGNVVTSTTAAVSVVHRKMMSPRNHDPTDSGRAS